MDFCSTGQFRNGRHSENSTASSNLCAFITYYLWRVIDVYYDVSVIYIGQGGLIGFLLPYASWYGSILLKKMLASFLHRHGVVLLLICQRMRSAFVYQLKVIFDMTLLLTKPITTLDKQLSSW